MSSSTTFFLLPHVYSCELDDGVVFLDSNREKYLALNLDDLAIVRSLIAGLASRELTGTTCRSTDDLAAERIANSMVESGLLTRNERLGKRFASISLERSGAIEFQGRTPEDPRIGATHLLRFAAAFTHATLQLRRYPFRRVIDNFQLAQKRVCATPTRDLHSRVAALVNIFRRIRILFYTAEEKCLFDSFVLAKFLAMHGVKTTWVFGVATRPFGAHSWVQHEGVVLNDTLDHAQKFTPILVL